MHLADGIVAQTPAILALNLAGVAACGWALGRSVRSNTRKAAWTGTLAAFVLAAQALNLPLLPGASAHLIGAALLTLTVGPASAATALFAMLLVQALLFADGGISVLGINALHLAILPVCAVSGCRWLFGESPRGLVVAAAIGTLLGNLAGALSLSGVLVIGAQAPVGPTLGWLLGTQAVCGLVEGVLTAAAIKHLAGRAPALLAARSLSGSPSIPHALDEPEPTPNSSHRALLAMIVATAVIVALLPLASSKPDALESIVAKLWLAR
jgi:cobalt/nickel transport system permease protein